MACAHSQSYSYSLCTCARRCWRIYAGNPSYSLKARERCKNAAPKRQQKIKATAAGAQSEVRQLFLLANCVAYVVVTFVVTRVVVAGHIIYQAQRKKQNIFVMLNCQTAHLVITYFASSALTILPPPTHPFAVSPVVCHLACHTHAADTHTRTPTQNVIKSYHASLRLSYVFVFIFVFVFAFVSMFVSVSVAFAHISITPASMQHFNESPHCHLSNSDTGPTGVTNVNYFILLPQSWLAGVRCDWTATEI